MRRRALMLSSLLAACALAAAGCAGSGGSPDASGLLASTIRAVAGQTDMKVLYAVTAKVDGTPPRAPRSRRASGCRRPCR
jgi:hypothetical protein